MKQTEEIYFAVYIIKKDNKIGIAHLYVGGGGGEKTLFFLKNFWKPFFLK